MRISCLLLRASDWFLMQVSTFHLARRIGAGRSLSALMLSEAIGAKTALEWGLVYAQASRRIGEMRRQVA
jgi:enoyl-CoA hydratase/carnithine racemase